MIVPLRGSLRSIALGVMLLFVFATWPVAQAQAAPVKVTGINLKELATQVQMAIVATGPVRYQVRDLNPNWIVVDIPGTSLGMPAGELPIAHGVVKKVRVGEYATDTVRVVVELSQPVRFHVTTSPGNMAVLVVIPTQAGQPIPERAEAAQLPLPPAMPSKPAPSTPTPVTAPSSSKTINLELRNADIADVLSALAKLANVNIVTDADVTGKITVRLIGVTFDEAMHLILDPNGLGYALVGNNIVVAKKEKLARPVLRQYEVSNMLASQFADSYLPITGINKAQVVVDDNTNSLFIVGTAEDQAKVSDLLARVDLPAERAVTRVIHLSYLDPASFVDLMGARLPASVTGKAKIDKVSNSVVLTASAAQMQIIDGLLGQVDTAIPQVLIESMVVEVPTEETKNLGVAWQTSTPFTITSTGGQYPCCPQATITSPAVLATLNTLIQQNKSKLLANPRLAVRDGETAKMNIGDKIPFQVINAQGVPSVVIIEAGVQLEITPRINSDGYVTVKMHPEVSSIKTAPAPNVPPTIATREADTSLTVKDGTPIVLAGLIQKNEVQNTVKVPLLGDIPLIGWLFKSVSTDKTDNEVIFVITPHILPKIG
ncbi:MAG TPA: secretin N-terminal domain-containing protein [bacterium]|nr:secretin N-terminal domain-containing protein [bacterium]